MTKLKKFISILLLAICTLLYRNADIHISVNTDYLKIIKITFSGK